MLSDIRFSLLMLESALHWRCLGQVGYRFASGKGIEHDGVKVSATVPVDGAKFRVDSDLLKVIWLK